MRWRFRLCFRQMQQGCRCDDLSLSLNVCPFNVLMTWYILYLYYFTLNKSCLSLSLPVKLPWIFPGAPLKFNGAPGNIQCNWTGMYCDLSPDAVKQLPESVMISCQSNSTQQASVKIYPKPIILFQENACENRLQNVGDFDAASLWLDNWTKAEFILPMLRSFHRPNRLIAWPSMKYTQWIV